MRGIKIPDWLLGWAIDGKITKGAFLTAVAMLDLGGPKGRTLPAFTIAQYARLLNLAESNARKMIAELEETGAIRRLFTAVRNAPSPIDISYLRSSGPPHPPPARKRRTKAT